jgi:hypothetical protein
LHISVQPKPKGKRRGNGTQTYLLHLRSRRVGRSKSSERVDHLRDEELSTFVEEIRVTDDELERADEVRRVVTLFREDLSDRRDPRLRAVCRVGDP